MRGVVIPRSAFELISMAWLSGMSALECEKWYTTTAMRYPGMIAEVYLQLELAEQKLRETASWK